MASRGCGEHGLGINGIRLHIRLEPLDGRADRRLGQLDADGTLADEAGDLNFV